jgi:hypothetical protein
MDGTTVGELHGRLLRDTFPRGLGDRDAFLLFALFHQYQVELSGPVLTDGPQSREGYRVAAITQRGCSAALASLWHGTEDPRGHYAYWYYRWNGEWGSYAHAENLTQDEEARLRELTAKLEGHPFVRRFVPED